MRTSIATVCLSGTLAEKMRAAADADFDGIEIFEQDLLVSPHTPAQIRQRALELGLSLDLFQPFRDLEGVGPEAFAAGLHRLEAKLGLAQELGITTMLVCSNAGTATIDDDALAAEQLRQAGELAAGCGVRLAYEALAWGRFVSDFEHAARIVALADHPFVGTCLDSFHILSRGWDTAAIEQLDPRTVFFVQLADAPALSMDVLSWSRHHRVFPGEGDFDLVEFMGRLHACGYDGPISLEIFNDSFRQTDVARTAVDGLRSLRWLEDQAHRSIAASDQAAEALGPLRLRRLPAIEQPRGWGFAELRTGRLGETTRMLHQLGFALGGHHRSKDSVQLWVQGGARVVVGDLGPSGAGTELAAQGLEVTDTEAALERARLLGAQTVPRTQRHDEQVPPVLRAPDGSELVLCPADEGAVPAWAEEFGLDDDTAARVPADGRILGIDHISTAQTWHHLDEAVLFFTSVLGLEALPVQEIPGPAGLVRSRVMRTADDAVRMPLSAAPAQPEQGPFLAAAAPEHVAFSCRGIEAVARRAVRRGMDLLPVPQNYYADLAARFDLDPALLAQLQELNLLYDRDEHGELLHFYTGTLGSAFFEVLERRGGYAGFGAANAPVRLAAQYRRLRDAARGVPR